MRRYWYWVAVFILLLGHPPARAGNLNIAFRYDDCSARSNGLRELALLDLFRSREAGITFAVIPFVSEGDGHSLEKQPSLPFPEERAAHLRQYIMDGTLEVALHGCLHQNTLESGHPAFSDFWGMRYSEFFGLSSDEQIERLSNGKAHLEKIFQADVVTFVPPGTAMISIRLQPLRKLVSVTFPPAPEARLRTGHIFRSYRKRWTIPIACGI